ncbi:MAG TPA: DUF4956 domain-containing protein, partial [Gemmatimonadaceae bacterium]|nr:DUF4956 domain-containing protein [Gemmatimonadaceae bacterium]
MLASLIDVITMKSDRPMRRLLAYYGIVTVLVLALAYFFPRVALRIGATGLGDVAENPTALMDALNAQPAVLSMGVGSLADTALTLLLLLFGSLLLMLPVSWVYMSARPLPGHSQTIVQTLLILPPVVAGIVFIVQNSLALAFSLAGIMAAVRFRTTLRDTRDLVYIFLSIVVGFAAGVQSLMVGAIVSIFFNYLLLFTWRYDYGRSLLTPTAQSQWLGPLHTLASPTGELEIPDRDLVLSLTPEKAEALSDRFGRVSDVLGKNKKKPRFNSVLTLTTDNVSDAQQKVEQVLDKMTKRWKLDEVVTNTGKPSEMYYILKLKKSVPRDDLLTGIHQGTEGLLDSANLETGGQMRVKAT